MIVAAGLSPAWQQVLVFDSFSVGQVNRARQSLWSAQGKVLNVANALHHLGCDARAVTVLGGTVRAAMVREFESLGVSLRWIGSRTPSRICTTIVETGGRTTELVQNAPPLAADEIEQFASACLEEASSAEALVFTGSLPAVTRPTLVRDLLAAIHTPVVLDIRGPELLAALESKPLLIKPNREELAATLGRPLDDDSALRRAMLELHQRGAQWVVVSHGKDAVWCGALGECYRFQPPRVTTVNAIGSGDCLAAGIARGITLGNSIPDAVRYGIAAAADNVGQLLPARLDPARVAALVDRVTMEKE